MVSSSNYPEIGDLAKENLNAIEDMYK